MTTAVNIVGERIFSFICSQPARSTFSFANYVPTAFVISIYSVVGLVLDYATEYAYDVMSQHQVTASRMLELVARTLPLMKGAIGLSNLVPLRRYV